MPIPPDALETLGTAAVGTVLGGTIVRFLVNKWLTDRAEFERRTDSRFALMEADIESRTDKAVTKINDFREEGRASRDVLRNHIDHEIVILRERFHTLSGDIQTWMTMSKLNAEQIGVLSGKIDQATTEMHSLNMTVVRLTERLPQKG